MKNKVNKIFVTSVALILCLWPVFMSAQTKFQVTDDSWIKVSGTSTLHNWEMTSERMKSEADFTMNSLGQFGQLLALNFSIRITTLKSDNSRLDKNAYDALKATQFPEVVFRSRSAEIKSVQGNKYNVKVTGKLTVAGVTKDKVIEAVCEVGKNNSLICTGETSFKMTEFNVSPPAFMFGAMKTGDEITINYKINYTP